MAWSEAFAGAALNTRTPIYLLESANGPEWPGGAIAWSSVRRAGYVECILPNRSSVSWGSTSPPTWSGTGSTLRLAIDHQTDVSQLLQGSILRLSVELGQTRGDVFIGVLRNISWTFRGEAVLEIVGLESALWSRYPSTIAEATTLFSEAGEEGTCQANIGAAATSISIDVTPEKGASGYYCLYVEPAAGSNPPHFILGTTLTLGTPNVLSGLLLTGGYDTTRTGISAGSLVRTVAYDEGHPIELLNRCVDWQDLSWGDGWRMMLPSGVYDRAEANRQVDEYGTGASDVGWKLFIDKPIQRASDWILPMLADAGIVLTQRQGLIAPRCIIAPEDLTELPTWGEGVIVDASWSAWALDAPPHLLTVRDRIAREPISLIPTDDVTESLQALYRWMGWFPPPPASVLGAASVGTDYAATRIGRPWTESHEHRLPVYGGSPGHGSGADRTAWRQNVGNRVWRWAGGGRPEVLTVTVQGWRQQAIGDGVRISHPLIRGRGGSLPGASYAGSVGLIIGGGPDLFGETSTYTILTIPDGIPT